MIKFNIRGNKNSTEFNNIQELINFCKGNNIISDDELFVYDSFKFLRDKFNIVDFDDCWYLYHKTN